MASNTAQMLSFHPQIIHSLVERSLLVLDGDIRPSSSLVLPTDEVRDLLVLGLLNGRLVVLLALAQELLLHEIDACESVSIAIAWE
jgi:hypothetical protein